MPKCEDEVYIDNDECNNDVEEEKEKEQKEQIQLQEECNDINCNINEEEYVKLFENSLVDRITNSAIVKKIKNICLSITGIYYSIIHILLGIIIVFIICFVNNKVYLCMTLLIITLDGISNVILFDCPLTCLEKKYLKTSVVESRLNSLQKSGMMYANNRIYDTQLEAIINCWTVCALKILILIVLDYFHISY